MRLPCVVGGDRPRGADDRCVAFACYVVLACLRAFLRCLPVWEGISSDADVCLVIEVQSSSVEKSLGLSTC